MIVVYPLLVSPNISPNALPGIVKAVEKYIMVYNLDDVLEEANSFLKTAVATGKGVMQLGIQAGAVVLMTKYGPALGKAVGLRMKEGDELSEQGTHWQSGLKNRPDELQQGELSDREKEDAKAKQGLMQGMKGKPGASTKIELPKREGISLEPTWVQVQSDTLGSKVLGVKVVPFTVKSGEDLMTVISYDASLQGLERALESAKRSLIRVLYGLIKIFPFVKGKTITGDIKHDIIWAASKYGKNMFVCVNSIEVEQDDIFTKPETVNKLHRLGWSSIIIADDVNKKATFCMKEFGGMCSVVPYGLLYSAVGKEHYEVYQNISDVKHAAGPFFRLNTKRNKIFENRIAREVYNKYSGLEEGAGKIAVGVGGAVAGGIVAGVAAQAGAVHFKCRKFKGEEKKRCISHYYRGLSGKH